MTLSIIVPVYNKSRYIDACIDSILAQTFTEFELILVNDGSTDDSGERLDNFARKDPRVKVIHQVNKGVSAARNIGLETSTGEFIGFVDADDLLDPDMYETLVNNARKYNSDVTICGVKRVFDDKVQFFGGKGYVTHYDKRQGISAYLNGEMLFSNYDKLFKYETIKNIRFEPALYEDTFYNFECLKEANLTVYDDAIKYNYIMRDNSHSIAPFNQKYMNMTILSKRMVDICVADLPEHIDEARTFDVNTNMMVLNMIIIGSRKKHEKDFQIVYNNLKAFKSHMPRLKGLSKKYKYGYKVLMASPALYSGILKAYSVITNSEYLSRK